jgi:hypothetical protein
MKMNLFPEGWQMELRHFWFCVSTSLLFVSAALHPAEEPEPKRPKTSRFEEIFQEASMPRFINAIIDGKRKLYQLSNLSKACLTRSAFFAEIMKDKNIRSAEYLFPISAKELEKFERFCQAGGTIHAFKLIWAKKASMGFSTLNRLAYDIFQYPGSMPSRIIFHFPQTDKHINILPPLLFKMMLNLQNSKIFEDMYNSFQEGVDLVAEIPKDLNVYLENPEQSLPLLLNIATLPEDVLISKGGDLIAEYVANNNLTIDETISLVAGLERVANDYLKLHKLAGFFWRSNQGLTILKSLKDADERKIVIDLIERIRNENDTIAAEYKYYLNELAINMYVARKLAPLFGYNQFSVTLSNLLQSIKPSQTTETFSDINEKMLLYKLRLLMSYLELGFDEWYRLNLGNFALFILEWSRAVHKQKDAIERKLAAIKIFNSFEDDLRTLGISPEQIEKLREIRL